MAAPRVSLTTGIALMLACAPRLGPPPAPSAPSLGLVAADFAANVRALDEARRRCAAPLPAAERTAAEAE